MNKTLFYLKETGILLGLIIVYLLIFGSIYYIGGLNYKIFSITSFIVIILLFIRSGFIISQKLDRKGYLSGSSIGIIIALIFLILSLILNAKLTYNSLLYYIILIFSSTVGGIVGANLKDKKNKS